MAGESNLNSKKKECTTNHKEYIEDPNSGLNYNKSILNRSNHTMNTVKSGQFKLQSGLMVIEFTSYIFGGLVEN